MQFNRYTWPQSGNYDIITSITWKIDDFNDKFVYISAQGIPGTKIIPYYYDQSTKQWQIQGVFNINSTGFFELTFPESFLVNTITVEVGNTYINQTTQTIANSLIVDIITEFGSTISQSMKKHKEE